MVVPLYRDGVVMGRNARFIDNVPELLGLRVPLDPSQSPSLDGVPVDGAAVASLSFMRVWIDDHAGLHVSGNDGSLLSDAQVLDRVRAVLPSTAIHG